jgi:uncharacterized paraquat-inducible protein A
MVRAVNLALLVAFPVAWFAPLIRAGVLPLFGLTEISVITGLQTLWEVDAPLALLVTFLAVGAPMAKTVGLALLHAGLMARAVLPALHLMGRLAMADVFLIAVYVVVVKGVGLATVEVAWGLWLFTGCVAASLWVAARS